MSIENDEYRNEQWPDLDRSKYSITSPIANNYNCVAWAADKNDKHWWPFEGYYWPEKEKNEEIESFVNVFKKMGYIKCEDEMKEKDYEKVAIYTDNEGNVTHIAKQLKDGHWTSKMGMDLEDIKHKNLDVLNGPLYGTHKIYLKRKI